MAKRRKRRQSPVTIPRLPDLVHAQTASHIRPGLSWVPDSAQRFPAGLGAYRRLNRSGSTARDSAMDAQLVPEAEIHWSWP